MPTVQDDAIANATALLNQVGAQRPAIEQWFHTIETGADEEVARRRAHYDDGIDKIFKVGTACVKTFKGLLDLKKQMEEAEQSLIARERLVKAQEEALGKRRAEFEEEKRKFRDDKAKAEARIDRV